MKKYKLDKNSSHWDFDKYQDREANQLKIDKRNKANKKKI